MQSSNFKWGNSLKHENSFELNHKYNKIDVKWVDLNSRDKQRTETLKDFK